MRVLIFSMRNQMLSILRVRCDFPQRDDMIHVVEKVWLGHQASEGTHFALMRILRAPNKMKRSGSEQARRRRQYGCTAVRQGGATPSESFC